MEHTSEELTLPDTTLPTGVARHWLEAGDRTKPPVVWIHGGSIEDSSFMAPDLEPFVGRLWALRSSRTSASPPEET